MILGRIPLGLVFAAAIAVGMPVPSHAADRAQSPAGDTAASDLDEDDLSPALLGMYRKVMEIDAEIVRYAAKYHVDPTLARAVCMFESGGNGNLTSGAGAHGYFQVMPATFRLMRVPTNIEAGLKYLGQMISQFGREDYALAAYNGGPGRVALQRPMPLESLQYVIGVGHYRSVLKMHESAVREHAARLALVRSRTGDDWWALSQRLELPVIQLRLYNPFISEAVLARGPQLIAYPAKPRSGLIDVADDGSLGYRARIGDNYINLAFAFGTDVDELRNQNGLWRLQVLPAGMTLRFPPPDIDGFTAHVVSEDEDLEAVALRLRVDPWQLVRDNNLWDQEVEPGMILRVRRSAPAVVRAASVAPAPAPGPKYLTHRVRSGENLTQLARRYGTTISAIQRASGLGRRTTIRVGERLRIPAS